MSAALLPAFAVAALLLAAAGIAKVVSPHAAQAAISVAGVRVPLAAVRLIGVGELGLAAAALIAPGTATAFGLAAGYAAFALFTSRLRHMSGSSGDCGCFGGAGSEASALHLTLNALACLVCALAAVAPPKTSSIFHQPPLTAAATCIGLAAATYAAYLAFTVLPRSWRSYGSEAAS